MEWGKTGRANKRLSEQLICLMFPLIKYIKPETQDKIIVCHLFCYSLWSVCSAISNWVPFKNQVKDKLTLIESLEEKRYRLS